MDIFKKMVKKYKGKLGKLSTKTIIKNTAVVAALAAILLIGASEFFDKPSSIENSVLSQGENAQQSVGVSKQVENDDRELEQNLSDILSKIDGAGKVDAFITYYSSKESVPAMDEKTTDSDTQEKDKEGGSRSIKQTDKQKQVIYEESGGAKRPFVTKELSPQVKGVVIVADGAADIEVKSNLINAATALLDLPAHKVQVFKRNNK